MYVHLVTFSLFFQPPKISLKQIVHRILGVAASKPQTIYWVPVHAIQSSNDTTLSGPSPNLPFAHHYSC